MLEGFGNMALVEGVNDLTLALFVLEGKAVLMRREVVDLHKALHSKMDAGEFDKRMDGLIELVQGRKKETHKHKDVH